MLTELQPPKSAGSKDAAVKSDGPDRRTKRLG